MRAALVAGLWLAGCASSPARAEMAEHERAEAWVQKAQALEQQRALEPAELAYREALALEPGHTAALEGLARRLVEQGEFEEALLWVDRAIAGGCSRCRSLRAAVVVHRGDEASRREAWPEAEAAYIEAMAAAPDAALALALARAHYAQHELQSAATALATAQRLLGPQDLRNQQFFMEVRRAVVLLALVQGEVSTADTLLDLVPQGVAIEAQLDQILEVTAAMASIGAPEVGARRLEPLVEAASSGRILLDAPTLARVQQQLEALRGSGEASHPEPSPDPSREPSSDAGSHDANEPAQR